MTTGKLLNLQHSVCYFTFWVH